MKITYIRPLYPIDKMEGREDIDWCRCYQADDYSENYMVITEGKINGIRINGEDSNNENVEKLAETINPDYDPEIDGEEQARSCMHRCGCLSCPWAKACGAMNDDEIGEIYKVIDDDGDVSYYVENEDFEIKEITPSDVFYPLENNDSPLPFEVDMASAFAERHFHETENDE